MYPSLLIININIHVLKLFLKIWEKEAHQARPMCPLDIDVAWFPDHNKNGSKIHSIESTDPNLRHRLEFGVVEAPEI